jgi:acyl carrier protein
VNDQELRAAVLAALRRVAPGPELDRLGPDDDLRDRLELDSMDFLTFVDEIFDRTGIDVPERDYPSLTTLGRCVAYLAARAPAG